MAQSDQAQRKARTEARQARRRRQLRRQRAAAVVALVAVIAALVLVLDSLVSSAPAPSHSANATRTADEDATTHRARRRTVPQAVSAGTYRVSAVTLHLIDTTRTITLPSGQVVPRPVTTVVRYPTLKRAAGSGSTSGGSARAEGPFPLIIFGHGFDILPSAYARLLHYWTSAGFVVAAPIFPLENPDAAGGPNESDLPNQPQDMRFVISSLLKLDQHPGGPLSGLIDKREVAVAGHSDGGDTALALAYDPTLRDPHLQAAVILSGAEIPMLSSFRIGSGGPPLLATQGTADTINLPSATAAFFDAAPPPKYLLQLIGASHIGPYATDRTQLRVVERVTTAFLQYYLDRDRAAIRTLMRSGRVPGIATLAAYP